MDLDLPRNSNPRTQALATQMRSDPALAHADTAAMVDAVLLRLRSGGYTYTLDPGVYGRHSADEFWFDRKEGFCEHIASAFVILMRGMDVPARIVTGYQGGELNRVDGYWVVRQSDAHAWAEVWMDGRGWVRVDPTAAVAPGRVGSLQRLHAPSGLVASAFNSVFGPVSPDTLARLRASWEALNNGWNQWVLDYSQSRQLNILKDIGFESPRWEDLVLVLAALLVVVSLLSAAWTLWERRQSDPWLRLLQRTRARALRAGLALPASAAPRHIAALLQQRFGAQATAPLRAWLLQLEAQRYARVDSAEARRTLAQLQREFRQLTWPTS
jgi:transglutaminase-like putative cysteine protease